VPIPMDKSRTNSVGVATADANRENIVISRKIIRSSLGHFLRLKPVGAAI
jgi:hypothetical protein